MTESTTTEEYFKYNDLRFIIRIANYSCNYNDLYMNLCDELEFFDKVNLEGNPQELESAIDDKIDQISNPDFKDLEEIVYNIGLLQDMPDWMITREQIDYAIETVEAGHECPMCSGSGEGMYDGSICGNCGGKGQITYKGIFESEEF